jgi:cellulose synthase/poly-beta-1,6-N-acetylglucosamine synthase-like glycosyltransferase
MPYILSTLLVFFAGLIAVPVFIFCLEAILAILTPEREGLMHPTNRQRIAVLVPAHNESSGLLATLEDIQAQLKAGDRLLVVADNCTDDTATVAAAAGAEVTERHEQTKIGKGYALAWGIRYLSADPPQIVIMIDADCRVASETLDRLAGACMATNQPVQSLYLMTAPDHSPIEQQIAIFAFRVKNWVRPLGLRALNLPCQLMGTGMAVPWKIISSADLATGAVVEDLKLGLELAQMGHPPLFCPSAHVDSQFPSSVKGVQSQRKRWEQGHIGVVITILPKLAFESLAKRNLALMALTLDAAVPPLTLLGMLIVAMVVLSTLGVLVGHATVALAISAASLAVYFTTIFLCWWKFGRDILPLGSIGSMARYVVGKLSLYRQILSSRSSPQWIRTARNKIEGDVSGSD